MPYFFLLCYKPEISNYILKVLIMNPKFRLGGNQKNESLQQKVGAVVGTWDDDCTLCTISLKKGKTFLYVGANHIFLLVSSCECL